MSEKPAINNNITTGVSLASMLTVTFVALKLIGIIDWNWVWVLFPAWGAMCCSTSILLPFAIFLIYYRR